MYLGVSLSSGSARGLYQLGALHAAQCKHLLTDVKYWAGTSIGAMIALLCAVGWQPIDILTYLCTNDISEQVVLNVHVQDLFSQFGLINTSTLYEYFRKMVVHKYGGVPTFEELYNQQGITFLCTAYQLRSKTPCVYFSHRSHPQMSTLEAAMLSANLPLIFQNRKHNDNFFIDGGVFDLNPAKYLCMTIDHDLCIESKCNIQAQHSEQDSTLYENEFQAASKHSQYHYLYALDLEHSYTVYQQQKEHTHPDYKVFSVNLDIRSCDLNVDEPINSMMDYIKEILYIPMFAQPSVESDQHIDNIDLKTNVSTIVLKLNNKVRFNIFVKVYNKVYNILIIYLD
jgi:predicted acylesterase/phospholipase RssA